MKSVPTALANHIAQPVTTLALCWNITRNDGTSILGTSADFDIVVPSGAYAGTYKAASGISGSNIVSGNDLSVDNLEVAGSTLPIVSVLGLSAADIEAGLFDNAQCVLFAVNWASPSDGQLVLRFGTLGNISRTAEGQFTAELRGLAQRLTQPIIRTYSATCDADLGDTRCGVDMTSRTFTGAISSVVSDRVVTITCSASPAAQFTHGSLKFTSGANSGYTREIKLGSLTNQIELFEPFPNVVTVADAFIIKQGCDKQIGTCRDTFSNVYRFRGLGVFTPTVNSLIAGPTGAGPV